MHKFYFSFLILTIHVSGLVAQDKIVKLNGDTITAKVLEVNIFDIKFLKYNNLNGPSYLELKKEIKYILYENGLLDIFNPTGDVEKPFIFQNYASENFTSEMYEMGRQHALENYDAYRGASTGTFFATILLSPVLGLVPAIACSATPPHEINLNFPDTELMKNRDYYMGYTHKARSIKSGKIWGSWGLGTVITGAILTIIVSTK